MNNFEGTPKIVEQGKVYMTYEYDMFSLMKGNRKPNSGNINHLVESMKEKQLIIPIIVNADYEIIDGQHRFNACRLLGLPVYYIVNEDYTIDDVIRANVHGGRKWFDSDYLNRYCELEVEDYMAVKAVVDTFNVSTTEVIRLLAKVSDKKESDVKLEFREGKINVDHLDVVIALLEDIEIFKDFKAYKTSQFIAAFARLYIRKDYNHKVMKAKLKTYKKNLGMQRTSEEYLSMLCNKIYSVGQNSKSPIFYSSESKRFHK